MLKSNNRENDITTFFGTYCYVTNNNLDFFYMHAFHRKQEKSLD
jgi:hypothetical protein